MLNPSGGVIGTLNPDPLGVNQVQHGHIYRNKLDGVWESFDSEGNKIAVGNYDNGVKAGTWFFWTDEQLIEVEFTNNKVQDVIYWNTSERTASR